MSNFVSREELISRRYRDGEVTTSLERKFKIKSLDPKSMIISRGSAFLPAFNDFIETQDPSSLADPEVSSFIDDILCIGVTSVNLVTKTLEECVEDEVPIEVLDIDEKAEIFSAIMELSSTEDEKREWSFFRDADGQESSDEVPVSGD